MAHPIYAAVGPTPSAAAAAVGLNVLFGVNSLGGLSLPTHDASGTPGAATINLPSGKVAIAASASSVVVTNSLVTSSSTVLCVLETVDGTLTTLRSVVPTTGSFTINGNASATGNVKIGFLVLN